MKGNRLLCFANEHLKDLITGKKKRLDKRDCSGFDLAFTECINFEKADKSDIKTLTVKFRSAHI